MKGQSGQDRKRSESVQDYRTAEQVRVRNIETKTQSHGGGRGESGGRALGSEGGLARGSAVVYIVVDDDLADPAAQTGLAAACLRLRSIATTSHY